MILMLIQSKGTKTEGLFFLFYHLAFTSAVERETSGQHTQACVYKVFFSNIMVKEQIDSLKVQLSEKSFN